MQVTDTQLKMIAIGLVPVFLILSFTLPESASTTILLGVVMAAAFVVCFIGMSRPKQEDKEHDDLLAMPPKRS